MNENSDNWPAYNVERRAVSALKPYKGNARTHSDEQVEQIATSIREWGWTQPILVDEKGGVIAGHGRLLAAQVIGAEVVPVIVARGWSKAQKRAYVLADNQLTLNAGWDLNMLSDEVIGLKEWDFDLSLLGFSNIEELLGEKKTNGADTSPQLSGLVYSVVVRCKDEAQQGEILEQLENQGLTCEALIS